MIIDHCPHIEACLSHANFVSSLNGAIQHAFQPNQLNLIRLICYVVRAAVK